MVGMRRKNVLEVFLGGRMHDCELEEYSRMSTITIVLSNEMNEEGTHRVMLKRNVERLCLPFARFGLRYNLSETEYTLSSFRSVLLGKARLRGPS